jgi:holliday junction DNA helicase RuvA
MFNHLRGILAAKNPPLVVIEVGGVGYEVQLPLNSCYDLPEENKEILLYTHFVVREDGHFLFGFLTLRQRSLFRSLIKVNGIGPKLALAILSEMKEDIFVNAVLTKNSHTLSQIPGIGKKTAERIIMEMKDPLSVWQMEKGSALISDSLNDAISALVNLGYKPQDANQIIFTYKDQNLSSAELIKIALRELGKK